MSYARSSSSYERNWSERDVACAVREVVLLLRPARFILITRALGCSGWISPKDVSLMEEWLKGTHWPLMSHASEGSQMNTGKGNCCLIQLYLHWRLVMRFHEPSWAVQIMYFFRQKIKKEGKKKIRKSSQYQLPVGNIHSPFYVRLWYKVNKRPLISARKTLPAATASYGKFQKRNSKAIFVFFTAVSGLFLCIFIYF